MYVLRGHKIDGQRVSTKPSVHPGGGLRTLPPWLCGRKHQQNKVRPERSSDRNSTIQAQNLPQEDVSHDSEGVMQTQPWKISIGGLPDGEACESGRYVPSEYAKNASPFRSCLCTSSRAGCCTSEYRACVALLTALRLIQNRPVAKVTVGSS